VWWISAIVDALKNVVSNQVAQTADECTTTDRFKVGVQFHRAPWAMRQIENDQHRPLVANHLERSCDWAAIKIATYHLNTPFVKS
jgi:hypothetical protein